VEFSLGFVKSNSQFVLKQFNHDEEPTCKILDVEEILEAKIQGLVVDSQSVDPEQLGQLTKHMKYFPVRQNKSLNLNLSDFENLDFSHGLEILKQAQAEWAMQNNLQFLSQMFETLQNLVKLYPNDRTAFFEELWFLIKGNLAASELSLLYNDIEIANKGHEKNKLVRVKVTGGHLPNPVPLEEVDEKLLESYAQEFGPHFQLCDFVPSKGHLTATATIQKSPILIFGKVNEINRLQLSLLKALFDGLNALIK